MLMAELCLIRHGQTDWNVRGVYQGHTDITLNETGILQGYKLADTLLLEKFDAIFSSDLQRAYQTAVILAEALALPVQVDQRLREICQGEWEGQTVAVVREKYTAHFEAQKLDLEHARAPGGESVAEVAERMRAAANEITAMYHGKRVVVVSHGLSLATLVCQAQGISLAEVYHHIPDNGQPRYITWQNSV